jgi:ketosteroid isomerase-like protein
MRLKHAMVAGVMAVMMTAGCARDSEGDARAALEGFHARGNAEDIDGLMEFIHQDCIVSMPNQDFIRGKPAFRRAYSRILDAHTNIRLSVEIVESRVVGDEVELMWYTVGQRTNAATNVVQTLRSANLALFKRDNEGQMRFYRISNHPAAATTP